MGEVTWSLCLELYRDLQNDIPGIIHRIKNVDWVDFTDFYKSIDPSKRKSDIYAVKTVMEKIQHLKGCTVTSWLHEPFILDSYKILLSVLEDVKIDELNISMDNIGKQESVATRIRIWLTGENMQGQMRYLSKVCEICQVKKLCARNCRLQSDQLRKFMVFANDTEIIEMDIDGNPDISNDDKIKLEQFLEKNKKKAKTFMVEDMTAAVTNSTVKRSTRAFYESHHAYSDVYHIGKDQMKGKVLIINNDFEGTPRERIGSLHDLWNQDALWTELGFDIEIRRNLTASEMRDECREFSKIGTDLSIVIAIIMTHHEHTDGQERLVGKDGQFVLTADIITMFDSQNSPHLHGIPKIFLFHTCGNDRTESDASQYGPMRSDMLATYPSRFGYVSRRLMIDKSWFMNTLTNGAQAHAHDTGVRSMESDMLLIYPSVGYAPCIHKQDGSWLMNAITNVFQRHAHDTDVLSMMVMVNAAVSKKITDGPLQISSQLTYLRKKLYLFPGWPNKA